MQPNIGPLLGNILFAFLLFYKKSDRLFIAFIQWLAIFIVLSWKGFQCCVKKNKIETRYIKFSTILRPSKGSTLRFLRRPKNPSKRVGLRYIGC